MLIHDDVFSWEGFGGVFQLAAGSCRLRIFDLSRDRQSAKVAVIKPIVVVVSDLPDDGGTLRKISVRSCASHIATRVVQAFRIDPQRMTYVEYHPGSRYGEQGEHVIPAKLDVVDFTWFEDKALHAKWRPLAAPMRDWLVRAMAATAS